MACLVLALVGGSCTPGEQPRPVPSAPELAASLLTTADLDSSWQTEQRPVVVPAAAGSGLEILRTACPQDVTTEPPWQVATTLSAADPEAGRFRELVEFALADDPEVITSTFDALDEALARCAERTAATGSEVAPIEASGMGDDYVAARVTAPDVVEQDRRITVHSHLLLVREGPVLAVVATSESVEQADGDRQTAAPSLSDEDFVAIGVTAVARLREPRPQEPRTVSGVAVAAPVPWWNETVFYEVFVRSFADGDADGTGDLRGLIDRLDYLNDGDPGTDTDLGVTGLWLMPVTQAASYHGYDTVDYYDVEDDYGTNDDLRELVAAAHDRGMRVIVDLVLNHTSVEHPWFVESAADPASARRDWYVWQDDDPGHSAPWGAPAWHPFGDDYYHGLFWQGMPDLNYRNRDVTEQMYDVAEFWIADMGVDGFRLDAIRHLIEQGAQYAGTPQTHAWLSAWDDQIDALDPQALTVGEVWDDTPAVVPYVADDEVDIAFEFTLAQSILDAVASGTAISLEKVLGGVLEQYPPGQYAPFLANHDQDRVMTQLDGDTRQARAAASILLTLPGVPFVYYGEEIGMTGAKPDELIRTPMQWNDADNAGFTSGIPWQPVNDDYEQVNVADQQDEPTSLLSHYRRLIAARNAHPALRAGAFLSAGTCDGTYGYLRTPSEAAPSSHPVLVLVNLTGSQISRCGITLESSSLAPGLHRGDDLLTRTDIADLEVTTGGRVEGYTPVGVLGPYESIVVELSPGPA